MTEGAEGRWAARRGWALLTRVLVWATPVLAGWGASVLYGRLLPAPTGTARTFWLAGLVVSAALVAHVSLRLARRLLPLAWLLKIDAAFPDLAPNRFHVALRTNRTADLRSMALDDTAPTDRRVAAERILVLAAALQGHDGCTRGHSERVRAYTRVIAQAMGVRGEELDKLAWAGLLHDVGKLVVEPEVLTKPSRLDVHEQRQVHQHPVAGYRIAEPLLPWLGRWGKAILHHHERFDGSGYPSGLAGESISLGGRIVAVADAFEAMTARRSYNTPRTLASAREELRASAGTHFDPAVVRAFLAVPLLQLSRIALPTAGLSLGTAFGGLSGPLRQLEGIGTAIARGGVAAGVVGVGMASLAGGVPTGSQEPTVVEVPTPAEVRAGAQTGAPSTMSSDPARGAVAPAQTVEPAVGAVVAPTGLATPRPTVTTALPALPDPVPLPAPQPAPVEAPPVIAVEEVAPQPVVEGAAGVVSEATTIVEEVLDVLPDPLPEAAEPVVDAVADDAVEDTAEVLGEVVPAPVPDVIQQLPPPPPVPGLGG